MNNIFLNKSLKANQGFEKVKWNNINLKEKVLIFVFLLLRLGLY